MSAHARCRALVAFAALICLSAGCGAAATPGESAGPKAPPGLETFYGQDPAFGPCADYVITDADRALFPGPRAGVRSADGCLISAEAPADARCTL